MKNRTSKMRLQTADTVREKGRTLPVVIYWRPDQPDLISVSLFNQRRKFTIPASAIYNYAGQCAANQLVAEKRAAKKAGRK